MIKGKNKMIDWISLHYKNKVGVVFTEFKQVGDFLIEQCGALPIGELKTEIGTYYKYSVTNMALAYKGMEVAWEIFNCR